MASADSSNNSININIAELQKTHYLLMKQCVIALNYISKSDCPLITSESEYWCDIENTNQSNIYLKISSKFIDIYLINFCLKEIKYLLQILVNSFKEIKSLKSLLNFIWKLIIILILSAISPVVIILCCNIFKLRILVALRTKLYIQNINNNLINSYSRLKATMNSDDTDELKNKLWLTSSINDCKSFNHTISRTISGTNSKIFLGLIGLLSAILPVILKNITSISWIETNLKKIPILNIISWQLILLLVLYLPTIIILMFLIQSFRTKYSVLKFFSVYNFESQIYKILNYKKTNTRIENAKFGLLLIQLFFLITAIISFVPSILDISNKVKLPLGITSILIIILLEIAKYTEEDE